jgi:hypothetical protein
MTNSRRKGATYERQVEQWIEATMDRVTRTNRSGFDGDDFDIAGIVSLEVKNCARLELASWLAQAEANSGPDRVPAVLHKCRGKADVGDHYLTMRARDFAALWLLIRSDVLADISRGQA